MKDYIQERVLILAKYIIETGSTVRDTAKNFCISKSTVHKDVTIRLEAVDKRIYKQVCKVLDRNKSERHLRGGHATKIKYSEIRDAKNRFTVNRYINKL